MKIHDRYTREELPGDWVRVDGHYKYGECPECGASAEQQCSALTEAGEGVEVGDYVHAERAET